MDGKRFDQIARSLIGAGESRRAMLRLVAGGTALAIFQAETPDVEAKKKRKRKKKRCKKTWKGCSGKKKCCSKRCCRNLNAPGKFCGPKKSTCCAAGGACPRNYPHCCDPEVVPNACGPRGYPVCCPAAGEYPDGFSCPAGYECCSQAAGYCCVSGGMAQPSGNAEIMAPGKLAFRLSEG